MLAFLKVHKETVSTAFIGKIYIFSKSWKVGKNGWLSTFLHKSTWNYKEMREHSFQKLVGNSTKSHFILYYVFSYVLVRDTWTVT